MHTGLPGVLWLPAAAALALIVLPVIGLVTEVIADQVMAQVEIQCGPHRVVSLMSSEAVRELGLVPGVLAVAVVKSTQVMVETPGGRA